MLDEERFPPFSTRRLQLFFFDKGHLSFVAVCYVTRRIGVVRCKTTVKSSHAACIVVGKSRKPKTNEVKIHSLSPLVRNFGCISQFPSTLASSSRQHILPNELIKERSLHAQERTLCLLDTDLGLAVGDLDAELYVRSENHRQ